MIVVNQDKTCAIRFNEPDKQILHTTPNLQDGKIQDFSLMLDDFLLGTFANLDEAATEITNILQCESKVHLVSGFCDYDGTEDFKKMFKYWTAKDETELRKWCNL